MIVGIVGRIGSGKDLIASLIQYIDSKSKLSYEEWKKPKMHVTGYDIGGRSMYQVESGWQIKGFGDKVKEIASLLTGIPLEKFWDQEFKKSYLGEEWYYTPDELREYELWGNSKPMTVRELLQKIATEGMRYNVHPDVWVNALMSQYKSNVYWSEPTHPTQDNSRKVEEWPNWIIPDVRFPNEFVAVQSRGGMCIKVIRPNNPYPVLDHPSETSLDNHQFEHEILNDGTIEDLQKKVEEILKTHNLK